jgi:3-hydroxyacyl-CoA dehydrogenase/enoyl-CoA hydratase/3-hydroxybutyryl-CoA epimerase
VDRVTGTPLDVIRNRDLELGPLSDAMATQDAGPWRHWKLRSDDDGIAWLVIDKQGANANTLSEDVLTEFDAALLRIERDRPKGLVIRSGKSGGFMRGQISVNFAGSRIPHGSKHCSSAVMASLIVSTVCRCRPSP